MASPNPTLDALPELFDPETGIITAIEFHKPRRHDPELVHCQARITDTARLVGGVTVPGTGGTALTEEGALVKAIGESVERYCGQFHDPESFIVAAYRELDGQALAPERFVLFHPSQYGPGFPFVPVSHDTALSWAPARSLTHDRDVLVPATQINLTYQPAPTEASFELSPLSGYACGTSFESAVLSGICEVVERDAFMIFWYNRLPVPSFDLHAAESSELRSILHRYHPAPVRLFCADITTDVGIPSALALMISDAPGWPAAVVATAAHPDTEQAMAKALLELSASHQYVRWHYEQRRHGGLPRVPAEIRNQEDHGLFYCSRERLPYLDVLTHPRRVVPPAWRPSLTSGDLKQDLETCVRRLAALGLEVLVADLTTPDIAPLGLTVVKVLIPGMQPIDFGPWRHLGGRRLYAVPARLGYPAAACPHSLNLFPHPFP